MSSKVETSTPANTMAPVGLYSHIAQVGQFIRLARSPASILPRVSWRARISNRKRCKSLTPSRSCSSPSARTSITSFTSTSSQRICGLRPHECGVRREDGRVQVSPNGDQCDGPPEAGSAVDHDFDGGHSRRWIRRESRKELKLSRVQAIP